MANIFFLDKDKDKIKEYSKKLSKKRIIMGGFLLSLFLNFIIFIATFAAWLDEHETLGSGYYPIGAMALFFFIHVAGDIVIESYSKYNFQVLNFNLGDIIFSNTCERWERKSLKIIEIGKKAYLCENEEKEKISIKFEDQKNYEKSKNILQLEAKKSESLDHLFSKNKAVESIK